MRFAVASFLFGACLMSYSCGPKKEEAEAAPVPVNVEPVAVRNVRQSWRYSGQIQAGTEVKLAFKQAGYVESLHKVRGADGLVRNVQVGDRVLAGTVLARLHENDYRASLNQAAGAEIADEASVGSARSELDQAKADQTKAELDFKRAQNLYDAKAMTRPDYDSAVDQYKSATAKVQSAVKQIEAKQGQVKAAQAQVQSARNALGETNLIAPMPAVIVTKDVEPGTLVASGSNGFTLDDTRTVKVQFGVPDTMLSHFKMGAAVPVDVQGVQSRNLVGKITEISASADTDTRVFQIQVSLANADGSLKVGMIAAVQILQSEDAQQVPLVPSTALASAQSGSTNFSVFVVREDRGKQIAQLRSVRVGETFGRSVAILEGLTPGETIIVNRPNQLADGAQVRAVNEGRN